MCTVYLNLVVTTAVAQIPMASLDSAHSLCSSFGCIFSHIKRLKLQMQFTRPTLQDEPEYAGMQIDQEGCFPLRPKGEACKPHLQSLGIF